VANKEMTSLERVLTTINQQEPDRVPFFLPLTMHGAKELGLSIQEYYSKAENVAEGQLRLWTKYRHDCLYTFFYAAVETEAWGGDVIYVKNGPPNAGAPLVKTKDAIRSLIPPKVAESPSLLKVLKAQEILKAKIGAEAPIIGVVMSPFSLPVMQLGFDRYIELLFESPEIFQYLMKINEEFCVEWANAQLCAGATAICYFDPVSSSTITPKEKYRKEGFRIAKQTLARINGPVATHMASGLCLPIIDDLVLTGTKIIGVSVHEDLAEIKKACNKRLTVLGNLNGIEMRRWSAQHAEEMVKEAIKKAGRGGGFILSDHHGEIPYQVPDEVLFAISRAVHEHGQYPLMLGNGVKTSD
jgi:uroporphyrinogen decarboxylase